MARTSSPETSDRTSSPGAHPSVPGLRGRRRIAGRRGAARSCRSDRHARRQRSGAMRAVAGKAVADTSIPRRTRVLEEQLRGEPYYQKACRRRFKPRLPACRTSRGRRGQRFEDVERSEPRLTPVAHRPFLKRLPAAPPRGTASARNPVIGQDGKYARVAHVPSHPVCGNETEGNPWFPPLLAPRGGNTEKRKRWFPRLLLSSAPVSSISHSGDSAPAKQKPRSGGVVSYARAAARTSWCCGDGRKLMGPFATARVFMSITSSQNASPRRVVVSISLNRPAHRMTCVCRPAARDLLRETTAAGLTLRSTRARRGEILDAAAGIEVAGYRRSNSPARPV